MGRGTSRAAQPDLHGGKSASQATRQPASEGRPAPLYIRADGSHIRVFLSVSISDVETVKHLGTDESKLNPVPNAREQAKANIYF